MSELDKFGEHNANTGAPGVDIPSGGLTSNELQQRANALDAFKRERQSVAAVENECEVASRSGGDV